MSTLKRVVTPVVRLTTVSQEQHEATFQAFARNVGRALSDRIAQDEPRIISFPLRIVR
ncbi:MAG: hypothetical protein AAGF45_12445 [Pseudomonadota bacterium]